MGLQIKNPITGDVKTFQLVSALLVFVLGTYLVAAEANDWPVPYLLDSPIWGAWVLSFFLMFIGLIFGGYSFKWFVMVLLFFVSLITVSVISGFNTSLIGGHYNYQYTLLIAQETWRIMNDMAKTYIHIFIFFNLIQAGFATGIFEFSEGTSRIPGSFFGGSD